MSVSTICDEYSRLTDRFPKRMPRGHVPPHNFLDFNFLKSPHRNVLIIGVYMVGIDLETLSSILQNSECFRKASIIIIYIVKIM